MIELAVADFLAGDDAALVDRLAAQAMRQFRTSEPAQLHAWQETLRGLRAALSDWPDAAAWRLVLEFPMRRLGRRMDAVLVTPRAVLVLEFKAGSKGFDADARRQAWGYALDLQDFHAASRDQVIVPILVATGARPGPTDWPLAIAGAMPPLRAGEASLPGLLRDVWARLPAQEGIDVAAWSAAPYRPVAGIIDAARTLYAQNSVADIAAAAADARNLRETTQAILGAIHQARQHGRHVVVFVTGTPGAGKTLCGLNVVFGADRADSTAFLTGNPSLIHVLREALATDAAGGSRGKLEAARRRMQSTIQMLPAFRDEYVGKPGDIPPERVVVIDEAQRSWSREHAVTKSARRQPPLTDSEPGHILDIMARRRDWAAVVCLIGSGQEIHTGEGGLAEWGVALAARPLWQVVAAPAALRAPQPRQRLPRLPGLLTQDSLHLDSGMRSLRNPRAARWADAVIAGDAREARRIAEDGGGVPFVLTRDLGAMRAILRERTHGDRRCGLIASSGAKRLRAEGLGAELDHGDAKAVAFWFLRYFPEDVRASGALDAVATEFACQGLELDHVGLCWGGDLVRNGRSWLVRRFSGTDWQVPKGQDAIDYQFNTYRVLLTRARRLTVIWVPRGDAADRTRMPAEMDAVADFLRDCGVPDAERPGEVSPAGPPVQASLV